MLVPDHCVRSPFAYLVAAGFFVPPTRRAACCRAPRKEAATDLHLLLPLGQIVDNGDTFTQTRTIVKGRRFGFIAHYGAERDTTAADRVANTTTPTPPPPGRTADLIMDLHEDKKRTRTAQPVDEFGAPTTEFDGTMAYTVDDTTLVNLTDNGDGSAVIAAVGGGALGVANLTFTATPTVGDPIVRVEAVNVIAGGAEGFSFVDGAEEEVTPDVPAGP